MRVWDLLFIKGNKLLFRISLAIFHLLHDELLDCDNFCAIMAIMEKTSVLLQDPEVVLQIAEWPQYRIK